MNLHTAWNIATVDALVLGISFLALASMLRYRRYLSMSGSLLGLVCIVAGITLFAIFHGIDFLLIAVLPQFVSAEWSSQLFQKLHPDTSWITGSYGLVLIVWGFLIVTRHAAVQIKSGQQLNAKLHSELEAREFAEATLKETQRQLRLKVENLKRTSEAYEKRGTELAEFAEELRSARDLAENASRSKSEFLALMSHELRTPLNAVIGFSEMIKGETFGPVGSVKYREYATDIHASGQHLLLVINDILDLSKIEAGAEELLEETVMVADAANTARMLVQGRAERGGVIVKLDLPEQPLIVLADRRKLKQILINLLSNSVKYTEKGGTCTLKVRGDRLEGMTFTITDTGIGIAADDLPHVMSRFGQVHNKLNRKQPGSGLGLPLTKSLIEMHGGTLSIESAVGAGTTAKIHLPPERVLESKAVIEAEITGSEGDDDESVSTARTDQDAMRA
jgi:signal transduction histidine kinase